MSDIKLTKIDVKILFAYFVPQSCVCLIIRSAYALGQFKSANAGLTQAHI